jgi:hypothetical protein
MDTLPLVEISQPYQNDDRLWCASAYPGHADLLLGGLDPAFPFVLIETWDDQSDWHEAIVSVGLDEQPRRRIVRHHRFDVLVTPAEAIEIGAHLHAQGLKGGGLGCFQFRQRPRATFRLPEWSEGRANAMRGQGVELAIDLPHDGEVAVVYSPTESNLLQYVDKLA